MLEKFLNFFVFYFLWLDRFSLGHSYLLFVRCIVRSHFCLFVLSVVSLLFSFVWPQLSERLLSFILFCLSL